jgi:hypothetical protein
MELGSCSRYSDWAIGWTVQGSNLGRDKRFISSDKTQLFVSNTVQKYMHNSYLLTVVQKTANFM